MRSTPLSGGPSQPVQKAPPGVTLCTLTPLVLASWNLSLRPGLAPNFHPIPKVLTPSSPPQALRPPAAGSPPLPPLRHSSDPIFSPSAPSPHPPLAWTPCRYHPPTHRCHHSRAPTCAPSPPAILPTHPPQAQRGLRRAGRESKGLRGRARVRGEARRTRGKRRGKAGSPRGLIAEAEGLPEAAGEAGGLGGSRGGRGARGSRPGWLRAGLTVSHGSHGVRGGGGGGGAS